MEFFGVCCFSNNPTRSNKADSLWKKYNDMYLEPQTTIYKWMFGETTISYVKIGNHPIETTIYKWLFGVPGCKTMQKKRMSKCQNAKKKKRFETFFLFAFRIKFFLKLEIQKTERKTVVFCGKVGATSGWLVALFLVFIFLSHMMVSPGLCGWPITTGFSTHQKIPSRWFWKEH